MTDSEGTERNESREAESGEDLDLTEEQADSVKGGVTQRHRGHQAVDKPSPGL